VVAVPAATFAAHTSVTPAGRAARRVSLASLVANHPAGVVTPAALAPAGPAPKALAPATAPAAPTPVDEGRPGAFARGTPPAGISQRLGIPLPAGGGTPAGSAMPPKTQPLPSGRQGHEHPVPGRAAGAVPSIAPAPAAMSGTTGGVTQPPVPRRTSAGPPAWPQSVRAPQPVGPPANPFAAAPRGGIPTPLSPAGPSAPERPRPREDEGMPHPQRDNAGPAPQRGTRGFPGTPALSRPVSVAAGSQPSVQGNPAASAGAPSPGMGHGRGQERPPHVVQPIPTSPPGTGKPAKGLPVATQ
jgi:hypothetical protein